MTMGDPLNDEEADRGLTSSPGFQEKPLMLLMDISSNYSLGDDSNIQTPENERLEPEDH